MIDARHGLEDWLDVAGLMPPLPKDVSARIFAKTGGSSAGAHTFEPSLVHRDDFIRHVLPEMRSQLPPELCAFIEARVERSFEIRRKLATLRPEIEGIVGAGNFSALWLDREAFSADSMEHRALITEAVVHVYSANALQRLVKLFSRHRIPMIPYGEGGGYNMGVTPMAPAVTVSVRGIDHLSAIRPSRRTPGKFEITVGAGVPFKDLVLYLQKRGYVLRCDPNTPRAATGGIVATGSNGGRKAFEVVLHGRAVTRDGAAVRFAVDAAEQRHIDTEPFLLARKFFSIEDSAAFAARLDRIRALDHVAAIEAAEGGVRIPLQGMKAAANMLAQRAEAAPADADAMLTAPALPISAFVGAEGCTGFVYEATFEIERPLPYLRAGRWNFLDIEDAMRATRAVKALPHEEQPSYFEVLTGASIRRYLLQDFPSAFRAEDEAVLIFAIEGADPAACAAAFEKIERVAFGAIGTEPPSSPAVAPRPAPGSDGTGTHPPAGDPPALPRSLRARAATSVLDQRIGIEEFEALRKPREELPKKLRTKCKTDMEIRTEYLGKVVELVAAARPRALADQKQDVLFGHLTPNHTAIIHWNIGGFDLYDEEQADIAWDYLERVIGQAQSLAPKDDPYGSARFTGEHGVAGKAPFLWLNYIPPADFARMCAVKDALDPQDLFNPETLFLRTSMSRALRARLFRVGQAAIAKGVPLAGSDGNAATVTESATQTVAAAESWAVREALRCTRCNSCKVCPVIDAEHELARERNTGAAVPVLPSKRNILMFLERMALVRRSASETGDAGVAGRIQAVTAQMLEESATLLKKCFYCRRCDKACPVDIQIHPLMRAYHAMGKLRPMGSRFWAFVYERLMGEDLFKNLTYRVLAFFMWIGAPFLALARRLPKVPDWLKTYTVPPTLSLGHYQPAAAGIRLQPTDNFVLIAAPPDAGMERGVSGHATLAPQTAYIRYRGCMDTYGNPRATSSVDEYFKEVLGARIVDLERKMCCGFPFEADGLHERARQSRIASLVEIAKCIARLREEGNSAPRSFTVFSNCPTCCEAIREMRDLLSEPEMQALIRSRAGLPADYDLSLLDFQVLDTAEIAMDLLRKSAASDSRLPLRQVPKTVGLKVPCHNSKSATEAQLALLKLYFSGVAAYDNCCGLSGTGRLKHPKIGTRIAEKLFDQIREAPAAAVVSGCPSCRDGVKMQRNILQAKKDAIAEFEVSGIFEQILRDCRMG